MSIKLSTLSLVFVSLLFSTHASASLRLEKVEYKNKKGFHQFHVNFDGGNLPKTDLTFKPNVIQLSLKNTIVWPKKEKKIQLGKNKINVTLLAYQFNKDTSRFRVIFPENTKVSPSQVKLKKVSDSYIIYLDENISGKFAFKKKQKNDYDDNYLEKLLNEKISGKDGLNKKDKSPKTAEDSIQTTFSSTVKDKNSTSLRGYMIKFGIIILMLAGVFIVIIQLMRKGILKKGKLNFLKNTQQIEQVSSMFLSPKRSLHLVKVGGQVFFIGSTDTNISILSELDSPTDVLKEAEKILTGDNFEAKLAESNTDEAEAVSSIKLKENIEESQSNGISSKKKEFVDQLKERVKNLKSLQ